MLPQIIAMLIKLLRHYVATSQGQRWNRIWVTTDICYNVITVNAKMAILTLHLIIFQHTLFYFVFVPCGIAAKPQLFRSLLCFDPHLSVRQHKDHKSYGPAAMCGSASHSNFFLLKSNKRSCRSNNQYICIDAQSPRRKGIEAYNTTSYNANIQVNIKVQ